MMGIKPGDPGVVIRYQVDEFTCTWSVECLVVQPHIHPGFTGMVLTLANILLASGCED